MCDPLSVTDRYVAVQRRRLAWGGRGVRLWSGKPPPPERKNQFWKETMKAQNQAKVCDNQPAKTCSVLGALFRSTHLSFFLSLTDLRSKTNGLLADTRNAPGELLLHSILFKWNFVVAISSSESPSGKTFSAALLEGMCSSTQRRSSSWREPRRSNVGHKKTLNFEKSFNTYRFRFALWGPVLSNIAFLRHFWRDRRKKMFELLTLQNVSTV